MKKPATQPNRLGPRNPFAVRRDSTHEELRKAWKQRILIGLRMWFHTWKVLCSKFFLYNVEIKCATFQWWIMILHPSNITYLYYNRKLENSTTPYIWIKKISRSVKDQDTMKVEKNDCSILPIGCNSLLLLALKVNSYWIDFVLRKKYINSTNL